MSLSLTAFLFVCLSFLLWSVFPSICLTICPSISLSISLSVRRSSYFVLLGVGGVDLSRVRHWPEDWEVLCELVEVNSLRQDGVDPAVLVVPRREEGSDDPLSDRIEMNLKLTNPVKTKSVLNIILFLKKNSNLQSCMVVLPISHLTKIAFWNTAQWREL
jgi:hypothetical protein